MDFPAPAPLLPSASLWIFWFGAMAMVGILSWAAWGWGSRICLWLQRRGQTEGGPHAEVATPLPPSVIFSAGLGALAAMSTGLGLIPGGYTLGLQILPVLLGLLGATYQQNAGRHLSWSDGLPKGLSWLSFGSFGIADLRSALLTLWPWLFFIVRWINSGVPHHHSDPLYYHVAAPAFWAQQGHIVLEATHPSYAQTGIIESLFGWGMFLPWLHDTGARLFTLILGQTAHFVWGQLLLWFLLKELWAYRHPKADRAIVSFLSWILACFPSIQWTGALAKTDLIYASFTMASLALLTDRRRTFHTPLAGLLGGWGLSTKLFGLFSALAGSILSFGRGSFKNKRIQWAWFGGLALATLPFFLRQILYTKNPFFPGLTPVLGPDWLSQGWMSFNAGFAGWSPPSYDTAHWFWDKGLERTLAKICVGSALLGAIVSLSTRKQDRHSLFWDLAPGLLWILLVFLWTKPAADGRYMAPALIFFIWTVWQSSPLSSLSTRSKVPLFLLPFGLLINIPLDSVPKIFRQRLFLPPHFELEEQSQGWAALQWLNQNARGKKVFFNTEKLLLFYLGESEHTLEMRTWEATLSSQRTWPEVLQELRGQGFSYAHFEKGILGFGPTLTTSPEFTQWLEDHRSSILYQDSGHLILSLQP